jgi:hypothetical protein
MKWGKNALRRVKRPAVQTPRRRARSTSLAISG